MVEPTSSIDPRAVGPFAGLDPQVWSALQTQVNRCLRRAGLEPVLSIDEDFSATVGYPDGHARVARCVEAGRRTEAGHEFRIGHHKLCDLRCRSRRNSMSDADST